MAGSFKRVHWMGSAWADLKHFPDAARRDAGHQIFQVQRGDAPEDFKPMSGVRGGVYEIRIHTEAEYRVLYVAKYPEAVYVLHAFEKRTRKTERRDIELARRRLAEVIQGRPG